jgi:hypothetical protein
MSEYIICPRLQAFLVGNHITIDGVMVSILASTCLPADCCFDELHLLKNPTRCVGLVQSGHHHHHESSRPNVTCSRHDIAEKLLIWCWTIFVHFFVGEGCRCLTSLCMYLYIQNYSYFVAVKFILFSGHPGISVNELSPLSLRRWNICHFEFDFHRLKMANSLLLEEVTSPRKRELIEESEKPWKKPPQTFHKSLHVLCYVVSCIRFLFLLAYTGPSWQHYRPPGKAVHWGPYLNLYNHSQE